MMTWFKNKSEARQSPTAIPDIKYELEKPRNCPSTGSSTTYGYPYSPSDNSVSTADGYAPINVFPQQQQRSNGLQPSLYADNNLTPLDTNPSSSRYAQTNMTIDISPGGTATLHTQQDELKRIVQQLQQQPSLQTPQDQLVIQTKNLNITNGVRSSTNGTSFNGGNVVNISNNNNFDRLTISNQMINTINNNLFMNGSTSPAYPQQHAYSPGSMHSPSPVPFQQPNQQQQYQPEQQFQLQDPMINMINNNQLTPNMNGGISPAYQQTNFLPVPMHSPSAGQLPQQQYHEQHHQPQQQQLQQQQQQFQPELQYQQVQPLEQSEEQLNLSDLIRTIGGVDVQELIGRNQNAAN